MSCGWKLYTVAHGGDIIAGFIASLQARPPRTRGRREVRGQSSNCWWWRMDTCKGPGYWYQPIKQSDGSAVIWMKEGKTQWGAEYAAGAGRYWKWKAKKGEDEGGKLEAGEGQGGARGSPSSLRELTWSTLWGWFQESGNPGWARGLAQG